MVKDFKPLVKKLSERPEQLQLYRLHDDGRRKIVMLDAADWGDIVEALNFVQEEARK